jgi:hypothetical protein
LRSVFLVDETRIPRENHRAVVKYSSNNLSLN